MNWKNAAYILFIVAAIISIVVGVKTLSKGECPCKKKDDDLAPIDGE